MIPNRASEEDSLSVSAHSSIAPRICSSSEFINISLESDPRASLRGETVEKEISQSYAKSGSTSVPV